MITPAAALFSVRRVGKTYQSEGARTVALEDVSLDIRRGEFVAIMGPSGSGKSTLLHILGLLDPPTRGTYALDGTLVSNLSEDELARVRNRNFGFVFQAFNLLPRANVFDNVELPLLYSSAPESEWKNRVRASIGAVGLEHRGRHLAAQLSGGEKQRTAIARALVMDPEVIFADEPTGNLDSKSGKLVMEILERLNRDEGRTIVLITHETYTARYAERIIHLMDGKVISDERTKERRKETDEFFK